MKRVPEPDLMEQKEQAYAYANADFSNSNELFLEKLFEFYSITDETKILDVGCGDGEIPIEIYKKTKSKITCLLYTSPSPRDNTTSRMPSSA